MRKCLSACLILSVFNNVLIRPRRYDWNFSSPPPSFDLLVERRPMQQLGIACELGFWVILGPKITQEKNHKDFELCWVFINNFLCQNFAIFPLYALLTKRIDTFWAKVIDPLSSWGIRIVWHRKSQMKNQQYQPKKIISNLKKKKCPQKRTHLDENRKNGNHNWILHIRISLQSFHNILRFLDVLPNFLFTTSETLRDYYL